MADKPTTLRHRNTKVGQVVSRSGDKTIVIEVTRRVQHPFYKRYINRSKKYYAHDEKNECQVGYRVRIVETRPLSRLKRWRLEEIIYRPAVLLPTGKEPEVLPVSAEPSTVEEKAS